MTQNFAKTVKKKSILRNQQGYSQLFKVRLVGNT